MWQEFKILWKEFNLVERIFLILFYPIGLMIGLLVAIFWNTYGILALLGVGICIVNDTIPPQEVVGIAGALALIIQILKPSLKKS